MKPSNKDFIGTQIDKRMRNSILPIPPLSRELNDTHLLWQIRR